MTFGFAVAAAISTWQDSAVEFALALVAVWVGAVVCAMCLNRIAGEANVIVIAATAPLIVAFLARGAEPMNAPTAICHNGTPIAPNA